MQDWIELLQWPAMAITVVAAWLVGSRHKLRRRIGFWCFLASNVMWIIWGVHDDAMALIVLQVCLAILNVRGAHKARRESRQAQEAGAAGT
jgi:hypothetical protein